MGRATSAILPMLMAVPGSNSEMNTIQTLPEMLETVCLQTDAPDLFRRPLG